MAGVTHTVSAAAVQAASTPLRPLSDSFVILIVAAILIMTLMALLVARQGLAASRGWSLGDALSEEADLTNDQGTAVKEMRASASRLIAFMGLIILAFLYLGFGLFILYYFGTGQTLPPDLNDIERFMLAGLTMFAPYAVNQFRAAFDGLTASPSAPPAAQQKAPPPAAVAPAPAVGC